MNEIDKLAWLYIKNKRLLVARSKGKDTYYIPGGKREHGETDEQALIRETKEELSIDLLSHTIKHAGTFKAQAHEKPPGVMVKISCYYAKFTGEIKPNAEIEETHWLAHDETLKCSLATQMVLHWLRSVGKV